jgi:hypothetical protein
MVAALTPRPAGGGPRYFTKGRDVAIAQGVPFQAA